MADGDFGARGKDSYELTRFNAVRHGILSKHVVLPWEDQREYDELLEALIAEHKPQGPTEEHLVEDMATIIWRKSRLHLAEKAAHFRALKRTTEAGEYEETSGAALVLISSEFEGRGGSEAITANEETHAAALETLNDNEKKALKALRILGRDKSDEAYQRAFRILCEEDQVAWWTEISGHLAAPDIFPGDPYNFECFIEDDILPKYQDRRIEIEHQERIKEQLLGEAVNVRALDNLARYEVHLDRKMARILTMLYKLKELRRNLGSDWILVSAGRALFCTRLRGVD
jgi:hypothetical protein